MLKKGQKRPTRRAWRCLKTAGDYDKLMEVAQRQTAESRSAKRLSNIKMTVDRHLSHS